MENEKRKETLYGAESREREEKWTQKWHEVKGRGSLSRLHLLEFIPLGASSKCTF